MSVDPVLKANESPYVAFSNSPVWIIDPDGRDTITYDNNGKELNRALAASDTRHVYLVQNNDGAFNWNGESYHRGHSYYSLFGDPDGNDNPNLFETLDRESFSSLSSILENSSLTEDLTSYDPNRFSKELFWYRSGYKSPHDYKNKGILLEGGESTVYEIAGVIYNRRELGMLQWGFVAFGAYGGDYRTLHGHNNPMHQSVEGNGDEWNELWAWTYGYVYATNKSMQRPLSASGVARATDLLLKDYHGLYWYSNSPYRGDPNFRETKDSDGLLINIKRAVIILGKHE